MGRGGVGFWVEHPDSIHYWLIVEPMTKQLIGASSVGLTFRMVRECMYVRDNQRRMKPRLQSSGNCSDGVKDTSLKTKDKDSTFKAKAKTKDFNIVLQDPRGRGLVLEDSKTGTKCFGEAPNTLHIYSVIGHEQNSKLLPLKSFVQNMQWLVNKVSSSFSKDLSHEAKA